MSQGAASEPLAATRNPAFSRYLLDSHTIEIDQIGTESAVQLAELQTRTFAEAYADVHSSADIKKYCASHYSSEAAANDLSSEKTVCCVGLLNAEPSGYYMVKHQACPISLDSQSSELKQIYVLSSAYGVGLGRALYEHALAMIRSEGNRSVWLCVSDKNHRAQVFYEKLGFEKIGAGPLLIVGKDELSSSVLVLNI